ncbi:MAG TPA: ASKHA domain-containing protein, partial [Dehalococcoidia bacterium]|nr:ASKHA domain-containing protein [Dehalococcoidia bacterium]
AGDIIFEVARDAGVGLGSFCGGKGTCGKCKIRILSGQVSPPTEKEREHLSREDIAQGYRLACLTKVYEAVRLEIPPEYLLISQRLQLVGKEREVVVEPIVEAYHVTLSPASLVDIRSDQVRILNYLAENHGLKDIDIDLSIQRQLPILLRANEWQAKIGLRGKEVVWVGAKDRLLGLAIDLGTTKIAAYLTDLETGEVLVAKGTVNHQIAYGEDVISRITYAMENGGEILRQTAAQDLNTLIKELCAEAGFAPNNIAEVVIVGNTAMHHLFLGLPVKQLALAPYVPAVSTPVNIKARDIGLATAPGAYVHLLANIAGFVGADHVAMLLATGLYDTEKTMLGLDIGTNTEISLATHGSLRSCSCASGPAFEGAHIKDGMRATGGAIERVKITSSSVDFQTIDDKPPIGLCGSGILDAVAQLREVGIIDYRGRLQSHPLVRRNEDGQEFVLVPKEKSGSGKDITITQKDIGEVQLAKGAMSAGMSILLAEANISWEEVDEVVIAGAFGSYIDVASAIKIGMLPSLPAERFLQVGNAAGVGAKLALVSKKQRQLAEEVAHKVDYIELMNHPHYPRTFAHALRL